MNIHMEDGLPFVAAAVGYHGQSVVLPHVLLDTGSAGTIFSIDKLAPIGVQLDVHDTIHRIRGVGGSEFVFTKRIDRLDVGRLQMNEFEIEVGALDYGIALDGIVGMDFLQATGAVIDLKHMQINSN